MALCKKCRLHRPGLNENGICPSCIRFHGEGCLSNAENKITFSTGIFSESSQAFSKQEKVIGRLTHKLSGQVSERRKFEFLEEKDIASKKSSHSNDQFTKNKENLLSVKPVMGKEVNALLAWSSGALKCEKKAVECEATQSAEGTVKPPGNIQETPAGGSLYRSPGNRITSSISFCIAGRGFYAAPLDGPFYLLANPNNSYDAMAIEIRNGAGRMVGHVPKIISNNRHNYLMLTNYLGSIEITPAGNVLVTIDSYRMSEDIMKYGDIDND